MINREKLYQSLEKIGIRILNSNSNIKKENIDIERTLVQALYEIDNDGRLLSLLFSWIKVHGNYLIADKFFKEYDFAKKYLGESPWFYGVCAYRVYLKDHRFKKRLKRLPNKHFFGNRQQESLIKLKGAIEYLKEINIFVSNSSLRIRESDIVSSKDLIKKNLQYKNRYIWGANWRSEIITHIMLGAKTPSEIAKDLGLAKSRVGIVFKEYSLAMSL